MCGCYKGGGCIVVMDVIWRRLCKCDFMMGDLFVLRWASISSELLMCGGGVHSIWLLPLMAICLDTINVCIWRMFVFMSGVVTVWGSVVMFVV